MVKIMRCYVVELRIPGYPDHVTVEAESPVAAIVKALGIKRNKLNIEKLAMDIGEKKECNVCVELCFSKKRTAHFYHVGIIK